MKIKEHIGAELEMVNKLILEHAKSHVELVPNITEYLVNSGGKRIRPMIALLSAKLVGADMEKAVKLAAAVEFIHTATLFHDDVIDQSELRRGKPTANNVFGNKACILVGDYLLSQAFKLMVKAESLEALEMLASAACTITESEVWQLEIASNFDLDYKDYLKLIDGKTAVLFAAAAASPALASSKISESKELYKFGSNLGMIFQLVDDVLDYYSKDEKFGKKVGGDFLEKKMTLPLFLLKKYITKEEDEFFRSCFSSDNLDENDLKKAILILNKYDISREIKDVINNYEQIALKSIGKYEGSSVALILEELIKSMSQRFC